MSKNSIRKVLARVHKIKLFDPSYKVSNEDYNAIAEMYTQIRFYDMYSKAHLATDPAERDRCWKEAIGIACNPYLYFKEGRALYFRSCIADFSGTDGSGWTISTRKKDEFDFDSYSGLCLRHRLTKDQKRLLDSIVEEELVYHLIKMMDYLRKEVLSWEDDKVYDALNGTKYRDRVNRIVVYRMIKKATINR